MCQMFVCELSCDGCPSEIFFARAEHRAHKRWQRFEKLRLMWRTNCERRGEKYFARAKNDVGQKWLGATDGERRGEKYFARATNDAGQKQTGGYAPPMADVWAKNFSSVPKMM